MTAKKWPSEMDFRKYFLELDSLDPIGDTYRWFSSHAAPEVPGEVLDALKFYADEYNYAENGCVLAREKEDPFDSEFPADFGRIARQALKSLEGCREAVGEDRPSCHTRCDWKSCDGKQCWEREA